MHATPEQLAMFHLAERYRVQDRLRRTRLITSPVEACAATRERLGAILPQTAILSQELVADCRRAQDD
jgi:hypothetical protein